VLYFYMEGTYMYKLPSKEKCSCSLVFYYKSSLILILVLFQKLCCYNGDLKTEIIDLALLSIKTYDK
jgi:hypothetical protein